MTRVNRRIAVLVSLLAAPAFAAPVSSTLMAPASPSATLAATPPVSTTVSDEDLLRSVRVQPGLSRTVAAAPMTPAVSVAPEIVVTASRMPAPVSQEPGAVAVVVRTDGEANHAMDLGDAIARTPSVDAPRYGGAGATSSIAIRGGRSSQVLVMQDGRPLNNPSTGNANPSDVPFADIDRVEIVRGPSGMLYGSSAIGGVVNVLTPDPPSAFAGQIAGEGGTFGTVTRRVRIGGPIGPVRLLGIESRTTTEGSRPNAAFRGEQVFAKAAAFENPLIEISGGTWGSVLGVPGVQPAGDPLLRTSYQTQFGTNDVSSLVDEQADRNRYADGKVTVKPVEGHVATVHAYAEVDESNFRSGTFRYDALFNAIPVLSHAITGVQAEGIEGQYTVPPPLLPESRIMAGGGWRQERLTTNEQDEDLGGGPSSVTPGMRARAEVGSAYTEWTIVPGRGLPVVGGMTLEGGARFDRHSIFGDITNSHAGATFEFGGVALKVAAGTAFRAPTLSDLFYPGAGNPQLLPERGRSMEGAIERRIDGTVLRAGVFQRTVLDQIDWAPNSAGIWQPHNVGRVTTTGDEFEASATWGRLSAAGNVSVLNAVQRQSEITAYDPVTYVPTATAVRDRFPAHVPRYIAGAMLGAELRHGTMATLVLRAAGQRSQYLSMTDYVTGANTWTTKTLKPYAVGTLRVSRRMGEGVTVWAGIENLTDVRYATHFGNDAFDQNYPMPGRTYFAGASAAW